MLSSIPFWMGIIFIVGYLIIIFEYCLKVNKTAVAILMAAGCWVLLFIGEKQNLITLKGLDAHVGYVSQVIFFLIGAMTLVEIIDSHKGFSLITDSIHTKSRRKLFWILGFLTFFLSALFDNLTTTIIMISILRKIFKDHKERMVYGAAIVIAANAGGAWTPIGDVTTTMLWIKGNITPIGVMKSLFLPSLFSMLVSLFFLSYQIDNKKVFVESVKEKKEPGAFIVFFLGLLSLVFVPVFGSLTGLPPFMSIFIGLGIIWLVTDFCHYPYETRKHLRIPFVLTKIDISGILFFLGILLCISSLEIIGILDELAYWITHHIRNWTVITTFLGILSAVVDNVPLVAAFMGMYDLTMFPKDSAVWQMIAYAAGTGGSILLIGSAAGVALMGIEKTDFLWYLRKITLAALTGYLAGMAFYLFLNVL